MSDGSPSIELPRDLDACQALIEQLARANQEQSHKILQLEQEKQDLELALGELLQRAFRQRSERYLQDPNQLQLDFPESEDAADAAEGLAQAVLEAELIIQQHRRRKRVRKPREEKFPEHWPRYEVEADVPDDVRALPAARRAEADRLRSDRDAGVRAPEASGPRHEVSEVCLPKDPPECGVASPERPTSLVEGNRYDTSVAAEVITGKYGYHLPIYRQQDYFAGSGWMPARSTLLNLLVASAFVFRPLVDSSAGGVRSDSILGTDDTRGHVAAAENDSQSRRPVIRSRSEFRKCFSEAVAEGKPSVTARMWAYRGVTVPLNVFDFTVSRHRDGPDAFLEDFCGKLMADCYSGYQGIELRSAGQSAARRLRGPCAAQGVRGAGRISAGVERCAGEVPAALRHRRSRPRTGHRKNGWTCGKATAAPIWTSIARVAGKRFRGAGASQEQVRPGARLSSQPLGSLAAVPDGRADADRQQRRRAVDEAGRPGKEELAFYWQCCGRPASRRLPDAGQQRRPQRPGCLGLPQGRPRPVAGRLHRLRLAAARHLEAVPPGSDPPVPRRRTSRPRRPQTSPPRRPACRKPRRKVVPPATS